jgi:TetR/AcrR family transcriptional regulator, cholesterol catabolism regulator
MRTSCPVSSWPSTHAYSGKRGVLPPRAVKRSREEELLQKATQLFSRGGFRETSLQDLASQLGITRPLFYYYFEDKEDLLWRIIGQLGDTLLDQARPIAAAHESPLTRLTLLFQKHIETLVENVDAFRIYDAERHLLTGKRDRRLKRGETLYHKLIADLVADGQRLGQVREGDTDLVTRLSMGSANSILRWYTTAGRISPYDVIGMTTDYVVAGLTPQPADAVRPSLTRLDSQVGE